MSPQGVNAADGATLDIQYGHYQEGERDLGGVKSKFDPIESDSMRGSLKLPLTERLKAVVNFSQDTWSGATPIATAPASMQGNRIWSPGVVTGASPLINAFLKLDSHFKPLQTDLYGNVTGGVDNQLVHTMSGASRETRKQVDFKLSQELTTAIADYGFGISQERDYQSLFGNLGGRWDFNQKLTTITAGMSYTSSKTNAILDHDATPYIYGMYDMKGNNVYNQYHASSSIEPNG